MQSPSRIDHIGIAVRSIKETSAFYRDVLGLTGGETEEIRDQKVRVAFFELGEARIELVEPTADDSPITPFLKEHGPGLHHVAYHVDDLVATLTAAKAAGVRLIDESPRDGAHGMKIAFVHPQATGGVLTEFCQPAD